MPHDKIKAAARQCMAETGEKYTTARRAVIEERAQRKAAEPKVTPENAQQLLAGGKITVNQAREAYGLPPFDPPLPPLVIPEGAGDWLRALLGPLDPEPSPGAPYTHVLKHAETEEEMAAEPMLPTHTVTSTGAALDIDNDPYDGDDSDPRCTHCNGEVWVECDDPIQCCDPRCDGEMHPDPACGGTGLYEHQVIF